jgi:heparan-alpha-glucosaminide N-acetyltransferase
MTTAAQAVDVGSATSTGTARIASIDVFRGLTMVVMIFVNDLASVHGLSKWTYHMPAQVDAMTYVDMVFPFFLFIVGMSIPLAVRARLKKTPSVAALWMHVVLRAISLVVLGLILANVEKGNPGLMHMSNSLWGVLALVGGVLFWAVYPRSERYAMLFRVMRVAGLVLMVVMFAIFRRVGHDGQVHWIDPSYPEILGLIGFTYLAVCILYIPTRRWLWAPLAWFVVLMTMCALATHGWLMFTRRTPLYFWPFNTGAMAGITMAGIVVSHIFLGQQRWRRAAEKLGLAVAFAVVTLAAGWLLTPLGISKIRATPTWCLYSVGAATLSFALLYWVCDVRGRTGWAFFARPAGSNTLMSYLVPDLFYFVSALVGFTYLESHFDAGWPGVARAVCFTALMLAIAAGLTKLRVRMQL